VVERKKTGVGKAKKKGPWETNNQWGTAGSRGIPGCRVGESKKQNGRGGRGGLGGWGVGDVLSASLRERKKLGCLGNGKKQVVKASATGGKEKKGKIEN